MNRWTHVLGLLKGVARADGDATAHFGSLLGFAAHAEFALRLNLIEHTPSPQDVEAPEFTLTESGRAFVEEFRLAELPAGRANYWHGRDIDLLTEPAAAELTRRWTALTSSDVRTMSSEEDSA